jgi:SecD/SecF fusion protein
MKSKGAVKFFAIALAIVCLFQLSFTFIANHIENNAEEYAQEHNDPALRRQYLDSVSRQPVVNMLFKKYTYQEVKERSLNLGLDLRGGMHVTLEIDMPQLLRQLSGNENDPAFNRAIDKARELSSNTQQNFIDLFYSQLKQIKPNTRLAAYFATSENREHVKPTSNDEEVLTFLREESKSALDRTFQVIRTRIDKFGVTQPNIQMDPDYGRIIVELPGVDDEQRVRKLLKTSARLEFYETYTLNEMVTFIKDADKTLAGIIESNKGVKTPASTTNDTAKTADNSNPLAKYAKKDSTKTATNDTSKNLKKDAATSNPLIAMLLPFQQINEDMAGSPVIGYVRISDTAKVDSILNIPEIRAAFPPEIMFGWGNKADANINGGRDVIDLYALRTTGLAGQEAVLNGDVIIDARKDVDPQTHGYVVSMQMNAEGAAEWGAITKRNAAKNPKGHIAIVLDKDVYSAPRVQNEIPNGNSQITGNFTALEAGDLANVLKSGKLPVQLNIVNETIVGPTLGSDAISKGMWSLIVGLIAVVIFMVLYYNRSGWVANIALLANLFFIIGILSSLGAALTLPGLAGIVLTLGMAVDANVLIYERVREELAAGKAVRLAVADGFKHAMSSIVDGNLTTLLIGIILLQFGSGPIYGFAVTLVIGILTSMFSAILISRLIFDWLLAKDKKINFGSKVTNNLFNHFHFDFVGKRKFGYWFSGITIGIGIISLFVNGLNYGVDFKGGYSFVVDFKNTVNVEDVRGTLEKTFKSAPEIKTFGSNQRLSITTDYMAESHNDKADSIVRSMVSSSLASMNTGGFDIVSTEKVGSTVARDVKQSAFWSILFSLLAVFAYIVLRFRKWQFALGATLALGHDVFFVLSLFSIFKDWLPFSDVDQSVVAALLTIVGYSINDTVVVFDRIREYLRNNKKSEMESTINAAINTTLSRTVITAFTVFLVVLILFIFGGPIIRGFSFALLVGVMVGTYSSIFVATPMVIDLHKKEAREHFTF